MTKREADYLTWLFNRTRRRLPLRGSLSSAFGAPLLQGATQQSCKKPTLRKVSSRPSSFRAQREIFLAQRSNGERQMRSSRSTHAILSLPHKYRVPLRRKRSIDSARDDDTRDRFPHIPFHTSAIPTSAPSGHLLPWEGGRMPLPHEEDLRYENTAFPHIVISSKARNLPCTPVKRRA